MLREARPRMRSVRCDDGAPGRRGARGAGAGAGPKKEEQPPNTNTDKGGPKEENLRYVVWRNRYFNRSTTRNEKRERKYSSELMITTWE